MSGLIRKVKWMQAPLEKTLFPVLLFIWPLAGCMQGVSVTDPSYALGNYLHLFRAGEGSTWLFATYLANCTGALLAKLPFGAQLAAMNIKTALLISITAIVTYYVLHRLIPGWMLFIGEWIAESLIWCPSVILYNTLTFVLLTFGCLFLFMAVSDHKRQKRWYVLAGVCLGLNVFVRFSNLIHVLLIIPVCYHAVYAGRQSFNESSPSTGEEDAVLLAKAVRRSVRSTVLLCLAGFAAGAAAGLVLVSVMYSPRQYFSMMLSLAGMGKEASSYTFGAMLASTFDAYSTTFIYLLWLIPLLICGFFLYRFPLFELLNRGKKQYAVHAVLYIAAVCVMFRLYYGQGMFTRVYTDYWCFFQWAMIFIMAAATFAFWMLVGIWDAQHEEKFLAVMELVLILILPLGSNNYTFPVIGNLMVAAPVTLWFFRRIWRRYHHRPDTFVLFGLFACMLVMLLIQSSLFHVHFAFEDGTDGTERSYIVKNAGPAGGMHTVPANGEALDGLYEWLHAGDDPDVLSAKVLAFGDIPGIIYYCELEPALSNLWPDLDSYPAAQFRDELTSLTQHPLVITARDEEQDIANGGAGRKKLTALCEYMNEYGYDTVYENELYIVRKAGSK